ncbi:MAG: DUF2000 domain-containing protein [Acidimicrobiales bacterium]
MNTSWKLAVAVRDDLESWQKLNVVAFVSSGIGTERPKVIGLPYVDASGQTYPPIFGLPVRIFAGDTAGLRRAFNRGLGRDVLVSVYTDEMFLTMNDADNRAVVAAAATEDLTIAGFAVAGDAKQIDKVFDKLRLHS